MPTKTAIAYAAPYPTTPTQAPPELDLVDDKPETDVKPDAETITETLPRQTQPEYISIRGLA